MHHLKTVFRLLPLVLLGLSYTSCTVWTNREEIGTLIELGKDQEKQEKVIAQEIKSFQAVYDAIQNGKLELKMTESAVKKRTGNPVLIEQTDEGSQKWLYKDGREDWFKGRIIRLLFDQDKRLEGWECIRLECPVPDA